MKSSAPCKAAIVTNQPWARKAIVLPIQEIGSIIRAREDERKRIGRELHDDLGQEMASLGLEMSQTLQQCESLSLNSDIARAMYQALYNFRSRVAYLTARIGEVSHQLHPTVLEHLGLSAAIDNLCSEFRSISHVQIQCSLRDIPRKISSDVSLCLYRITQEALHNIHKHAHASRVEILLAGENRDVILTIRDNGKGFNSSHAKTYAGVGLASMQERSAALGGDFNLTTEPGKGTEIRVQVCNGE
ncbi:MAG TPA: sensor histidine kinase [Terriglobales bacterium]|nr:sensor histidine kinase [Terriglobales bacterium]